MFVMHTKVRRGIVFSLKKTTSLSLYKSSGYLVSSLYVRRNTDSVFYEIKLRTNKLVISMANSEPYLLEISIILGKPSTYLTENFISMTHKIRVCQIITTSNCTLNCIWSPTLRNSFLIDSKTTTFELKSVTIHTIRQRR